jgi:hypothetical protein
VVARDQRTAEDVGQSRADTALLVSAIPHHKADADVLEFTGPHESAIDSPGEV